MDRILGVHILLEMSGCAYQKLNDVESVERNMVRAALESGAHIVKQNFHMFNPYGVSGVIVISESHIAIHTWPEIGYASVDVFTCGNEAIPEKAVELIKAWLEPTACREVRIERGMVDDSAQTVTPVIRVCLNNDPC